MNYALLAYGAYLAGKKACELDKQNAYYFVAWLEDDWAKEVKDQEELNAILFNTMADIYITWSEILGDGWTSKSSSWVLKKLPKVIKKRKYLKEWQECVDDDLVEEDESVEDNFMLDNLKGYIEFVQAVEQSDTPKLLKKVNKDVLKEADDFLKQQSEIIKQKYGNLIEEE